MKQTRLMMGMPITLEIVDPHANAAIFDEVFEYFAQIYERDNRYQ
jgi:thiamine biosynthesis lipoprotein